MIYRILMAIGAVLAAAFLIFDHVWVTQHPLYPHSQQAGILASR